MRILVTGASGFVGRPLVRRLAALGHAPVPLPRGRGAPADLAEIGAWRDWPADVEAVIHLAALNPARGEAADAARLTHANAAGTRALAARAAAEGTRRFVYLSTAVVHRAAGETPVTEADAPAPQTPYAASKLAGERALLEVAAGGAMGAAILRPPPIHGPGARNAVALLARLARSPLPLPLARKGLRRSVVGIENMIDAILLALTHPAAVEGPFLLADGPALSVGEMVAAMRRGLGRRPALLPLPGALLPVLPRGLASPFVVDDARIRARLGWRPPVAAEAALAATVRGEGA